MFPLFCDLGLGDEAIGVDALLRQDAVASVEAVPFGCEDNQRQDGTDLFSRGFYVCILKKDITLLRLSQKLVVTYMLSLELFFSLTPFRRHLLLTVGNDSGE